MVDKYSLELSTQILIEEAKRRKIEVEILDFKDNIIRLRKGNKVEYIQQATKTSADSYIVPLLMENKNVTKLLLDEAGISVPRGIRVNSMSEALDSYELFEGMDIVVKPNSTNFGKGVINLGKNHTIEEYKRALEEAFALDDTVLVEYFYHGKEYRFLVIDHKVVAVLHRVPANVVGDGKHTIEELVEIKNQDPLRGEGYVTPLEKIKLGQVEVDFLKKQGLNIKDIVPKGDTVYLRENSNVSTGGDSIDYTDIIPEPYKKIAEEASKVIGAKITGIDMIISDYNKLPDNRNYTIIELNFNPAIHMHVYPFKGKNRHVEKDILDLLGF